MRILLGFVLLLAFPSFVFGEAITHKISGKEYVCFPPADAAQILHYARDLREGVEKAYKGCLELNTDLQKHNLLLEEKLSLQQTMVDAQRKLLVEKQVRISELRSEGKEHNIELTLFTIGGFTLGISLTILTVYVLGQV